VAQAMLCFVRLGVLSNFSAGGGGQRAERIREFLRQHPDIPNVEPGGAGGVRDALGYLAERGVDVLAVSGGDGTLQRTLTELLSNGEMFPKMPLVAPLRAGRTNMSALDIGSGRHPVHALDRLRRASRDNSIQFRLVTRPVLRVDLGGGEPAQYGMFCGVGLIHRAIELVHRVFPYGRSQGVFGSSVVTFSLIARHLSGRHDGILNPDDVTIRLDGRPVEGHTFRLVIASTLRRLFLRINPFWGCEQAPIRFTALDPESTRHLRSLVKILRGRGPQDSRGDREPGYTSHNVFTGELSLDCGLTVDGELFPPVPGRVVKLSADERIRFVRS
jgi:diacylglycerol kinase (ATP)